MTIVEQFIVFIITLLSYSIKEGTFLFTKSKKINE